MPKYVFLCEDCGVSQHMFTSVKTTEVSCVCGKPSRRQMPNVGVQQVTEVVDKNKNVTRYEGQAEVLKKRRDDHYWNVEVPRLVQTMSTETCLEQGWLVYNEKNELVINKPPSLR